MVTNHTNKITKYYYKGKEITYSEKLAIEAREFRKGLKLKSSDDAVRVVYQEVDEELDSALAGAWWNMMF